MADLIDRQAAIDVIEAGRLTKLIDAEVAVNGLKALPSAQPSVKDTNVATTDTISRQAAIDALHGYFDGMLETDTVCPADIYGSFECIPSAQPEIIRCKDCKYARLTSDRSCKYCDIWFPDEAEYMDGDYYCASAERKSNG